MNNGYQKSNGCGADKEGGKIFNTFFYPELQSKHVRPLAYNSFIYANIINDFKLSKKSIIKMLTNCKLIKYIQMSYCVLPVFMNIIRNIVFRIF